MSKLTARRGEQLRGGEEGVEDGGREEVAVNREGTRKKGRSWISRKCEVWERRDGNRKGKRKIRRRRGWKVEGKEGRRSEGRRKGKRDRRREGVGEEKGM